MWQARGGIFISFHTLFETTITHALYRVFCIRYAKLNDVIRVILCEKCHIRIQGFYKRMAQFQKLTRNLFLTLNGQNVYRQQRQWSKFRMRYQQFASHAYYGAAESVSKMAPQQEKAFCVLRFEVSRSVITVQRECRARFRKDAPCMVHKKVFSCCDTILETGPTNPAVSMRSELLVAHERLGQLPLLTVYVLPV